MANYKVGDFGDPFIFAFMQDGSARSIADADTVTVSIRRPDGTKVTRPAAKYPALGTNYGTYTWAEADFTIAGKYMIEGTAVKNSVYSATTSPYRFTIDPRIGE